MAITKGCLFFHRQKKASLGRIRKRRAVRSDSSSTVGIANSDRAGRYLRYRDDLCPPVGSFLKFRRACSLSHTPTSVDSVHG